MHFLLRAVLPVILLAFSAPCVSASGFSSPVVLRQDISVTLLPERQMVAGRSILTLSGGGKLSLFLSPRGKVSRVTLNGTAIPHGFSSGVLTVDLPGAGESAVDVDYEAVFDDVPPAQVVSAEDPTYGIVGAVTAQGAFLGGGSGWYPETPVPPQVRTIMVNAPKGIKAVTAGSLVSLADSGDRTLSSWRIDKPLAHLALSAGPFVVAGRERSGVLLSTWFYSSNASLSGKYLDVLGGYLDLYVSLLGPYPFEKFAVVENFFPTGYGYPSYTLIGGSLLRLPFLPTTSLPHELVHSWWGNGVEVAEGSGNWSEGLTTYLADHLLEERRSPEAGRDYRLKILADYSSLVSQEKDFPLASFRGRQDGASRSIGYGKAAMVFHLLRREAGDEVFFPALRALAKERMYGSASWDDFAAGFSRASGRNLSPLVSHLVNGTGGFDVFLQDVRISKEGTDWVVTGKLRQETLEYPLPVVLELAGEGWTERRTLRAGKGESRFSFRARKQPQTLVMDPDTDIFRRLAPEELPPTVNRVRGAKDLLVVRCDSYRGDDETIQLLLQSLGIRGRAVPEGAVKREDLARHDLLFLGLPGGADLKLPAGFRLGNDRFSAEGKEFAAPFDLLFAALPHPFDPAKVAGVFLPLSAEAGKKGAVKIAHYGKYGYLVFSDGTNVAKGGFPAAAGKSVVRF